jgi:hypothetical protein
LLVGDFVYGGLWFSDPTCRAQFGQSGTIKHAAFDAFARCVVALHLRPTGRRDALPDTSVLTYEAGFEVEVRIVSGRLDFIGFSGRTFGAPDLPSITPEALETMRTAGDQNATISEADASRPGVVLIGPTHPTHTEHLRLCVGEDGELSVTPATMTSPESAAAFSAVARSWQFRPFVVGGKPTAVCSIVGLQYPPTPADSARARLPRPPERSKAGNVVWKVSPLNLERLVGEMAITPDDRDKIKLSGKRITGSFKLCLDETGHYESGTLLKTTGVPRYDAKIARELMKWAYKPYLLDGIAVPVCTAVTFIYSQN